MSTTIKYIGNYRFKGNATRHKEPYWQSTVCFNNMRQTIVDAAGIDENGQNIVKLLPYKEKAECPQVDEVLHNGDLLAYVQEPMMIALPSDFSNVDDKVLEHLKLVLKGRATHAELGYVDESRHARQVSLWSHEGPIQAEDRPFSIHTNGDTISIYRASLREYNVDAHTEALLKAEVKRWKEMVKPVLFPCGTERDIDPVDFNTIKELRNIAEKCVNHSPNDTDPLFQFKLNCVQWSSLVFSLAVCFPLSEMMLKEAGLFDGYKANWAGRLGYAEEGLLGIGELPIPFYTEEEIVENTLDMYLPEYKSLLMSGLSNLPLLKLLSEKGVVKGKRVMPNAFVVENRLRCLGFKRKTKTVFEYIATVAPEGELKLA